MWCKHRINVNLESEENGTCLGNNKALTKTITSSHDRYAGGIFDLRIKHSLVMKNQ